MPRTPLLLEARQRLRVLGDQLYYSTFADELVALTLSQLPIEAQDTFTPQAFPESHKAPRINVHLSELPRFRSLALATGFGAVVTSAYEVCESYVSELPALLGRSGKQGLFYECRRFQRTHLKRCLPPAAKQ
jgi:hypothetical protein